MRASLPFSRAAKARPRNLKQSTLKPSAYSSTSVPRTLLCEPDALAVVSRPISELEPYARNARSHPRAQLEKLAASIREFGFLIPILVDPEDRIIAGHARAEAARLLGLAEVPTIEIHHLCDAQIRAYRIADNRLAELAQWDEQALAIELKALGELDLSFDVEITGFELAEIGILIEGAEEGGDPNEADEIPELDEAAPPVSEIGDLWLLAEHRLLCADALRPESYERLLEGETAQMARRRTSTTSSLASTAAIAPTSGTTQRHAPDGQAGGAGCGCHQGLHGARSHGARRLCRHGTTIITAHNTGRVGCALELDPRYVDVAIGRWDRLSPKKAVHAETGLSFDELAAARRAATEARCRKRPPSRASHRASNRDR
jgi:ParB-like chromosome segregation protein Spo0J